MRGTAAKRIRKLVRKNIQESQLGTQYDNKERKIMVLAPVEHEDKDEPGKFYTKIEPVLEKFQEVHLDANCERAIYQKSKKLFKEKQ